jgi:hypothetical protein
MSRPGLLTALSLAWYLAVSPAIIQLDMALEVLAHADRLYAAQIGYAGTIPAEVSAWQTLSRSTRPDSLFKVLARLVQSAHAPVRLGGTLSDGCASVPAPRSRATAAPWHGADHDRLYRQ